MGMSIAELYNTEDLCCAYYVAVRWRLQSDYTGREGSKATYKLLRHVEAGRKWYRNMSTRNGCLQFAWLLCAQRTWGVPISRTPCHRRYNSTIRRLASDVSNDNTWHKWTTANDYLAHTERWNK